MKFTEVSAGNYEVIIEDLSGEGKVLGTTEGWLPQYGVIGGNNVITIGGPACVLTLKAQDSAQAILSFLYGVQKRLTSGHPGAMICPSFYTSNAFEQKE